VRAAEIVRVQTEVAMRVAEPFATSEEEAVQRMFVPAQRTNKNLPNLDQ
jgi:hypothetical protein